MVWDGPLYKATAWLSRTVALSALWLVASVPVLTIPASTAALFVMVRRWTAGDEPPLVRTFLSAFRDEFRRSVAACGVWALAGAIIALDLLAARVLPAVFVVALVPLFGVAALVYVLASAYLFPLLVLSDLAWFNLVRNAVLLATGRPLAALGAAVFVVSSTALVVAVPVLGLLWAVLSATVTYRCCAPVIVKVLTPTDPTAPAEAPGRSPVGPAYVPLRARPWGVADDSDGRSKG